MRKHNFLPKILLFALIPVVLTGPKSNADFNEFSRRMRTKEFFHDNPSENVSDPSNLKVFGHLPLTEIMHLILSLTLLNMIC